MLKVGLGSYSLFKDLYIRRPLAEVEAVRPEMIDEILQDVHQIRGDVVE